MIEVDGSLGEGGGQVIRTSVAMSAITGQPTHIFNIRGGRENPGLRPQHLKAVEAAGLLCDAEVTGLRLGSREVFFKPRRLRAGHIRVNVGSAGSVTLILQALLPVALNAPGEVALEVSGGTDVNRSPTYDYLRNVFCPLIRRIGCEVEVEILRRGFYPRGGGVVKASVKPWKHSISMDLTEKGRLITLEAYSVASEHLIGRSVAERQIRGFLRKTSPIYGVGHISRVNAPSDSIGSSFTASAKYENTVLGACVVGERGIRAEDVGLRAAEELLSEMASGAAVDCHMADQLIPYLAFSGGYIRVSDLTEHAKTNVDAVNRFGYCVKAVGDTISSDTF